MFFTLNTFDYLNVPGDSDDEQDDMYDTRFDGRYNYTYIGHGSLIILKEYKICTNRNIINDPQFDFM